MPSTRQQEELAVKQFEKSAKLQEKFFNNWSILCGGTIALIVPLLTELYKVKGRLENGLLLNLSVSLLVISLILANLWLLNAARGYEIIAEWNAHPSTDKREEDKRTKEITNLSNKQKIFRLLTIGGYVAAAILLMMYVNQNLF